MIKSVVLIVISSMCLAFASQSPAKQTTAKQSANKQNAAAEIEVGGLLLDNTVSRFGFEFYYQFSQFWPDIPNTDGINVQIVEQIVPRAGTKLSVVMNHQTIYATHLGRRQSPIKAKVESAIYLLIDAIAQSQMRQSNPDLAENGW